MRRLALSLLLLSLAARPAAAGMAVSSGSLRLHGGSIRTDALDVRGSLEGHGTLAAPSSRLAGVVAPCGDYEGETGTLLFDGAIEFDGAYACTVNGHVDVDLIRATGPVSGTATVQVVKLPAAIPLGQGILEGSPASSFTGFSLPAEQQQLMRLESSAPGQLTLTDLAGDSDSDGLPDWWEFAFYTNRTLALPGDDDDDDRSRNDQEFGAGTDPRNPGSVFALSRIDAGQTPQIQWHSVSGKSYTVQAAASPAGPFDRILATALDATPPLNTWTHSVPVSPSLSYRIAIEP